MNTLNHYANNSAKRVISSYKTKLVTKTCIEMFMATLFLTLKSRNNPKKPTTNERINRIWYIHTMKYYSATKMHKCYNMHEP